jgi:multidrug resistance efflux pump
VDIPRQRKNSGRGKLVAAACTVLALTVGAAAVAQGFKPKAPTVDRGSIWTGRVERGPLVMEVKGAGTLVPEEIRWITVETSGRVEKILLKPGSAVEADSPIVQLENSDLRLQALQADREVSTARSDMLQLAHRLRSTQLAEEAARVSLKTELGEAQRRAAAYAAGEGQTISSLDAHQAQDRAADLERRASIEDAKLALIKSGSPEELAAQKVQIERREDVARFRAQQVDNLTVRAGAKGTLQIVPIEVGQWVVPGTVLAKVVVSTRLKAELRVPENEVTDVAVGQAALIDTHTSKVPGHVTRIAGAASQGTVKVEIALDGDLPAGARADQSVDGYVETSRVDDAVQVARPVGVQPEADATLFRVDLRSGLATRVSVRTGRASVDKIEIRSGLNEGDELVLSDMSRFSNVDAVAVK